jgi:hypothetical protein
MIKIAELTKYHKYFRWEPLERADEGFVHAYIREREYVFDSDNCGDRNSIWVVMVDGVATFYSLHHEWWWDGDGTKEGDEDDDGPYLENTFEFKIVTRESLTGEAKENLRFVV